MDMRKRSTVVGLVVAFVAVAGAVVVARMVFGCTPPHDQAKMIELFEADPLSATAPDDGRVVQRESKTYWCDSGMRHGSSPTGPGFAEVRILYQTPTANSLDQLRQLFEAPAAAGGWTHDTSATEPIGDYTHLVYVKQVGCRRVRANIMASPTAVRSDDDGLKTASGIELILSASPQCGAHAGGG